MDKLLENFGEDKARADMKQRNAPLGRAVINGDINLVKLLIKLGADINRQNKGGNTPLMLAMINYTLGSIHKNCKHKEVVEYLLQQGADLSKKDIKGRNVLDIAKDNTIPEIVDLIRGKNSDTQEKTILFMIVARENGSQFLLHKDTLPKDMFNELVKKYKGRVST